MGPRTHGSPHPCKEAETEAIREQDSSEILEIVYYIAR